MHHVPVDVGEPKVASIVAIGQALVIDSEQVKDRGVKVVHVDWIGDRSVSEVVGHAMGVSRFHPAAREPDGEGAGVVIATGAVLLGVGCSAEFTAPPDEGILEQPALLQVLEQSGDGFVDGAGVDRVFGQV